MYPSLNYLLLSVQLVTISIINLCDIQRSQRKPNLNALFYDIFRKF